MRLAQTYSLEQVLGLKRQLEDQSKLQLAQAEQARQEQAERLDSLLRLMEDQCDVKVTPDMIEQRGQFFLSQLTRIQDARKTLQTAINSRDVAQAHLVQASIDRKKYEVHKESTMAIARQAEQVVEQNLLDESAIQVYLRQAR